MTPSTREKLLVKSPEATPLPAPGEDHAANVVLLDKRPFALWYDALCRPPQAQVDTDNWLIDNIDRFPQSAVLRIWLNSPCLVVSRRDSTWPGFSAATHTLAEAGFATATRRSGGTAVLHTPGVLNFTVCYRLPDRRSFSVAESYAVMNDPVIACLDRLGVPSHVGEVAGSYCAGRYDIVTNGKKLAGTAQRVKHDARGAIVLSHLSLNVSNSPGEADEVIEKFYRSCQRHIDIKKGLISSVNSFLPPENQFASARGLAITLCHYLEGRLEHGNKAVTADAGGS